MPFIQEALATAGMTGFSTKSALGSNIGETLSNPLQSSPILSNPLQSLPSAAVTDSSLGEVLPGRHGVTSFAPGPLRALNWVYDSAMKTFASCTTNGDATKEFSISKRAAETFRHDEFDGIVEKEGEVGKEARCKAKLVLKVVLS